MKAVLSAMVAMAALAGAGACRASTAPVLHCQVRYMSDTVLVDAPLVANPYAVAPHAIGTHFQFKAVMVGEGQRVDHIALYVYDMDEPGAPVLIHQVVHKPPFPVDKPMPGLTGWNHVYASYLGREVVYGCALQGGQP